MPDSVSVSTLMAEPVAVTPKPKPVADSAPALVEITTVRCTEPVPKAWAASVIWPLLVDTVMLDARLSVGRFTAEALNVGVLTWIVLPAEPPTTMPLAEPLSVTLTEPVSPPLRLALSLPALRYALSCAAVPYRLSVAPVPSASASAPPVLDTRKSLSATQLRLAPVALKLSVTGPAAAKGVLPKGRAIVAPAVVTKVAGNTSAAAALLPVAWLARPCSATVVAAMAPSGCAARTRPRPSAPAVPLYLTAPACK